MTEDFKGYSKIQSVSNAKTIRILRDAGLDNMKYEVREKIHGANFSITDFPDGSVKFGRRKGYLAEGENFHGYQKIAEELTEKVKSIRAMLSYSSTSVITVFGELFGGHFYGVTEEGTSKVQSGVQYHPDIKFMGFDIMVDGEYVEGEGVYHLLGNAGIDQAPIIKVCENLQEALDMPVDFTTTVPAFYGLECPPENVAEGYVIKPCRGTYTMGQHRLILKYKSDKFSENAGAKTGKAEVKELGDTDTYHVVCISAYINQNRLDNVLSKEGKLIGKDFSRIVGLLTQDALADFVEQLNSEGELHEELTLKDFVEDLKQFKREVNRLSMDLLRQTWAELIMEV